MTFYFIISALLFAVLAGITFHTKTVSHQQFFAGLLLFPIAYFVCGLPLANIPNHILAAVMAYVVGFILYIKANIGGGVGRAFTLAALWVPTVPLLFNFFCLLFIIAGAVSLLVMMFRSSNSSDRIDHYAAMAMAVCSGFFLYQYSEDTPSKLTAYQVQESAPPLPDVPALNLRGLSETE